MRGLTFPNDPIFRSEIAFREPSSTQGREMSVSHDLRCRHCSAPITETAVLCIECGTNQATGEKLKGAIESAAAPARSDHLTLCHILPAAIRDQWRRLGQKARDQICAWAIVGLMCIVTATVALLVARGNGIWMVRALLGGRHAADAAGCYDRIRGGMPKYEVESIIRSIPRSGALTRTASCKGSLDYRGRLTNISEETVAFTFDLPDHDATTCEIRLTYKKGRLVSRSRNGF